MRIYFISSLQYPNGGAAVNRHLSYAQGLFQLGNDITFLLTNAQFNIEALNAIDSLKFVLLKEEIKSPFLQKTSSGLSALTQTKKHLIKAHELEPIDAIVLLDIYVWKLFPIIRIANKLNIRVYHERTEYPLVVERKGIFGKLHNKIYETLVIPKFDGIYVINNALKNYFEKTTKNKVPVTIINMIVDPERFNNLEPKRNVNFQYIAYCGSMEGSKDGVDILIKAFGMALNSDFIDQEVKLMLIGDNSDKELADKLINIAIEAKCADNIIFTGRVDRNEIPQLLINSSALALARPNNKQAEGGFPTKLGEYLATGKPVIITNVGEIGIFLKDNKNAYIAEPDSINKFAFKIKQVFENYDEAIRIGRKGRELILKEFNNKVQAQKLNKFLYETRK